jgi:Obg family GTPase CgtA-like protein
VESVLERLFVVVAEERARAAAAPPVPVLRPGPVPRLEVEAEDGGFVVRGEASERAAAQLGAESAEARGELARRLQRMGVHSALKRAGVKLGDRIRIGATVLEWPL